VHGYREIVRLVIKEYVRKYSLIRGFLKYFRVEHSFDVLQIKEIRVESKPIINTFDFNPKYAKLSNTHVI